MVNAVRGLLSPKKSKVKFCIIADVQMYVKHFFFAFPLSLLI